MLRAALRAGAEMKKQIPSIFDLTYDDNDILRMPFTTIDYGARNSIQRDCHECTQPFNQGEMKELRAEGDPKAYRDKDSYWGHSIFFCENCWETSDISDASNWTA